MFNLFFNFGLQLILGYSVCTFETYRSQVSLEISPYTSKLSYRIANVLMQHNSIAGFYNNHTVGPYAC